MTYARQSVILGAVIVAGYIVVLVVVYATQRSLLYFPTHRGPPTRMALWRVNGELFGYSREVASPRRVWLMLHGNGGEAANREYMLTCVPATDAAYVLEYPGYGLRGGRPGKAAIDRAARDAFQALRAQYGAVPIGVIGESLGTGPASLMAKEPNPPDRIVLVTPFDELVAVAAKHYPMLPVRLLLRDRWNNIEALRGYSGRVEIFAAQNDTVIPNEHARRLAEAIHAPLTLTPGGHNEWSTTGRVRLE